MWINKSFVSIENFILENVSSSFLIFLDLETSSLQFFFRFFRIFSFYLCENFDIFRNQICNFRIRKIFENLSTFLFASFDYLYFLHFWQRVNLAERNWQLRKTCFNSWKVAISASNIGIRSKFITQLFSARESARNKRKIFSASRFSHTNVLWFKWHDETNFIYKPFDFQNQKHVRNALNFHEKMKIKSQLHSLTNNAFNLVINFSYCSETSLMFFFWISTKAKLRKKKRKTKIRCDEVKAIFWKPEDAPNFDQWCLFIDVFEVSHDWKRKSKNNRN